MSKGKRSSPVADAIAKLFAGSEWITSGEVAEAAGVTRQAAHYHLKALTMTGELVHVGSGRGGRYRKNALRQVRYDLEGLEEDVVWSTEYAELKRLDLAAFDNPKVKPILDFTFTEMLNNAIDHSDGSVVDVRWFVNESHIAFEIADDGVGVFRRMRQERDLEDDFDAIGEIAKGKQTTAPMQHSGLGIYFSSRMASRFILTSGKLTWTVDAQRNDQAVGWLASERKGTLVRCEIAAATEIAPLEVFREFSPPGSFGTNRSTLHVGLFERGDFVSRSEAKRMGAELEVFDEVDIDFSGVDQVGQGFVDELFRVWQRNHPGTQLRATNANPAISALVEMTIRPTEHRHE
jgi:hypothetical protein